MKTAAAARDIVAEIEDLKGELAEFAAEAFQAYSELHGQLALFPRSGTTDLLATA